MKPHIIKYSHRDGEPLITKEAWCGDSIQQSDWAFQDAQHALLSLDQDRTILPCPDCIEAIRKVLDQ